MDSDLTRSTELAIDSSLLGTIQESKFCIVGCGGVGALFSVMLVRTGATYVSLIDGDRVEHKNLNRTPFVQGDIGKFKINALVDRLYAINPDAKVTCFPRHFGVFNEGDLRRQEIRNCVLNADITIVVVDKNKARIECEKLLNEFGNKYLVIGVEIHREESRFVCGWMTKTPDMQRDLEGYGENNGSYMAIVSEAVSVGFSLMMHQLADGNFERKKYIERKYVNYFPVENSQEQ